MVAFLAALSLSVAQVPVDQPPRLRTVLPNGAVILVEKVPGAKSLAIDFFAAARRAPETPKTHGYRHLIEHIVAVGASGTLDTQLESKGGFLRAQTVRDCIEFDITTRPDGLATGLAAIKDILAAHVTTDAAVQREVSILAQEGALRDEAALASQDAWLHERGNAGLDPFGDLDVLRAAKAADVERVRERTFSGDNLVLTIVGDVDLDQATAAAKAVIGTIPAGPKLPEKTPAMTQDPVTPLALMPANFRAIPVKGWRDPQTAVALAAAMAVASELDRPTLMYTPSGLPGLILVGAESADAMQMALEKVRPEELFERGRWLASAWLRRRMADPDGIASLRGALIVGALDLKPEFLRENLETMKYSAFAATINRLKEGNR